MKFCRIPVLDEITIFFSQCLKVFLAGVGSLILTFPISIMGQQAMQPVLDLKIPQRFQTGLNVFDNVMADIDGDGNLDLAAVNGASIGTSTATLLFGTSDGGFSSPTVLPTDAVGRTIAVGDLNNDGRPDVVVATYIENVLIVFLNQGNRQFSGPVFTQDLSEHNGEYLDLAIADFDGDGTNDVVGLQDQSGQRLRFFHADAQGRLTVFAVFSQYGPTDQSYGSVIAVGDVNGDHRPDVVWFDDNPDQVWNTWFIYGQPPGTQLSPINGGHSYSSVLAARIADVDNDNDNDIVVISGGFGGGGLKVMRNDNGILTTLPLIPIDQPFIVNDLTVADFNGDGKQDLGVLQGSVYHSGIMVGIRYGVGDGTFTEGKYYATAKSTHIFSGDLNHDNKTDILTASAFPMENAPTPTTIGVSNNSCSVLLNENLIGFSAPLVKLWGPNFIDRGDFNEDSQVDMVTSWATISNNLSGADVSINDRDGGFFEEVSYLSPAALHDMKAGDFNGDGHTDVITAHWANNTRKLAVYFGDGSGSLGDPVVSSITQAVSKLVVADFNHDGKDDALVVADSDGYCMLSVGDGTFVTAPGSPIPLANTGESIPAVDVNGDHIPDLVNVSQFTNQNVTKIWIGDGAGRFTQLPTTLPVLNLVVAGDFNGDGKVDLAGTTPPVGTLPPWRTDIAITGFLGEGNGGFSNTFSQNIPDYSNYRAASSIVTADFDLDGFDDIAMTQPHNVFGNLIIIRSGGSTPSWQEPIFVAADTATRTLKVADFDGNGRPDIEWLGDNSRGVIYNGVRRELAHAAFDFDGDDKTDPSVYRPSTGDWYLNRSMAGIFGMTWGILTDKITPADFDGDGKTDVAVFRPSEGRWYIFNSATSTFSASLWGISTDIPAPADYDGDGKADIAIFRPSDGNWWLNRTTAGTSVTQFGQNGDVPAVGDYDGDGKTDIGIFRPSDGVWSIRRSTAGDIGYQWGFGTDKIVQADYDGDGKTDVAIYRPAEGKWYIANSGSATYPIINFGAPTDIPAPGDYDGDGKADVAIFRPSDGNWWLNRSTAGVTVITFGQAGDKPTPNAYGN